MKSQINLQRVFGALLIMGVLSVMAYISVQTRLDPFEDHQIDRQADIARILDAATRYTVVYGDAWLDDVGASGKEICAREYCGVNAMQLPELLVQEYLKRIPRDPAIPKELPRSGYVIRYDRNRDYLEISAPHSVRDDSQSILRVSVGGEYE